MIRCSLAGSSQVTAVFLSVHTHEPYQSIWGQVHQLVWCQSAGSARQQRIPASCCRPNAVAGVQKAYSWTRLVPGGQSVLPCLEWSQTDCSEPTQPPQVVSFFTCVVMPAGLRMVSGRLPRACRHICNGPSCLHRKVRMLLVCVTQKHTCLHWHATWLESTLTLVRHDWRGEVPLFCLLRSKAMVRTVAMGSKQNLIHIA